MSRTTNANQGPTEPTKRKTPPIGKSTSTTTFVESIAAAWSIPELRNRITFVFAMFGVYVVGLHVPLPTIDHDALRRFFDSKGGGGILNLVDVFSGGALKNFTVFAMGIVPYINSSIIMQLLTFAIPQWQELAREGETGRKRIAQYTRYLTVALAIVQACGLGGLLWAQNILHHSPWLFVHMVVTLVAGTSFLMWLGEMITDKGIGNGVSLIIFAGIMVRLPAQIASVASQVAGNSVSPLQALVLIISFFATVIAIVFVTLGQRRIPIQHVRRIVGNKMTQGGMSYLPFRIASAGVIPIIFAISIVLLPMTFAQYIPETRSGVGHWIHWLSNAFTPGQFSVGGVVSSVVYALIIIGFTYFYTAITMDIQHIAEDLKKYGSFIPGVRPGRPTEEYLDKVMTRITMAGALFLALVALLNYWIPAITNTGRSFTLVGGTSLLIVVGVALDTMQAIEAQLLMRHYEGFIR
ncbi:MAG: preprotein translocase subunit SecY [Capsulimonadaceae bacterium]|nr:preprotein translocase subunit SecY [Capsulimonadaceae bacterium]